MNYMGICTKLIHWLAFKHRTVRVEVRLEQGKMQESEMNYMGIRTKLIPWLAFKHRIVRVEVRLALCKMQESKRVR